MISLLYRLDTFLWTCLETRLNERVSLEAAATYVNVSPDFLEQQLASGALPSLSRGDLAQYRTALRCSQERALRDLTRESCNLGLYDLPP